MANAGRNDRAIADALARIADVVDRGLNRSAEVNEFAGLDKFNKYNPPSFKGAYDPDGALSWLRKMEKIFRAMVCTDTQRVTFATYMLIDDAEHWWDNCRQRMEIEATTITWAAFRERFLSKYFPADMRDKKEIEFMSLTQGDMTVREYAQKFEELSRFYTPYQYCTDDRSKCIKFESGLRSEIKRAIAYQQIRVFPTLVDNCRIFEDTCKEGVALLKNSQNGKGPYPVTPRSDGDTINNSKPTIGKTSNNGNGKRGPLNAVRCKRCGKRGHFARECTDAVVTCFSCGEQGHIGRDCPNPKKKQKNSGTEA